MRRQTWRLVLYLHVGLLAGRSWAQGPAVPLALDQAVQEAVKNNLNLLAEKYNLSVADARILTAGLKPNPVITTGFDYQDFLFEGFDNANNGGPPEWTGRIDWLFERGRKRERRLEVARAAKTVAELNLLNTTRQLIFDVSSAFVDVQAAQESLALAQENLRSFNEIVDINNLRVKAGDLAPVELMRSRVAALQFRNAVRQGELKLRTAQNRLRALLGRSVVANPPSVVPDLRRDLPLLAIEEVRQQASEMRPDLQAITRDQARSLADVRLQLAQGKVDYTVGVQYHRQYHNSHADALGVFVQAPLPIFNRNQGEVARAQSESRQLEARLRALRHDISTEVQNAYDTYSTARLQLESIEKDLLPEAKQVREITQYSYRRGEASFLEFLDAQRAYNDTVQSFNDARADYARSLYLIDSVTGKVVNP